MFKIGRKIIYRALVRLSPSRMGYAIIPRGGEYFDAKTVSREAKKHGLSIGEFLEKVNLGGVGKRRDEIISTLQNHNVLPVCTTIVEIGAGTGMYLEKFLKICRPNNYEVYETNPGWVNHLKRTYSTQTTLKLHGATGHSLHKTADATADIIAAHGVFVYTPVVITFAYLKEAVRVCKQFGFIIFDCFSDRVFTLSEIFEFRKKNPYYDFPVIVKEQMIDEFCTLFKLSKLDTFDVNYHHTRSTYYLLQKQ